MPPGKRAISCQWVFKAKVDADDRICTHNARLVALGFSQQYRRDYDETFVPVVKYNTIHVILAVVVARKLHVR